MNPTPSKVPVAIITGAGSGIGRAVALRLGRAGWRILLVGRDEERLRETDLLLSQQVPGADATELIAADISNAGQCQGVIDAAVGCFGRVDALINNAGRVLVQPIDETDEAKLHATFAVNTYAPALLIAAVWPTFVRQRSGRVVSVSSMAALDPFPGFFIYAGSKAALDGLTRSVAVEGREHGIEGYSVNPGAVETRMLRSAFSTDAVPISATLDPSAVAEVVYECAAGMRPFDNGRPIPLVRR